MKSHLSLPRLAPLTSAAIALAGLLAADAFGQAGRIASEQASQAVHGSTGGVARSRVGDGVGNGSRGSNFGNGFGRRQVRGATRGFGGVYVNPSYRSYGYGSIGYGTVGYGNTGLGHGYPYYGYNLYNPGAFQTYPPEYGVYSQLHNPYGRADLERQALAEQIDELRDDQLRDRLRRELDARGEEEGPLRLDLPLRLREELADERNRRRNQRDMIRGNAQKDLALGVRQFQNGSFRKAAEQFEDSAENAGDDPTPSFFLAQSRFAVGDWAGAARAVRQGLQTNPDWVELGFDLRQLYGREDRFQSQLTELAAHLKQTPLDRDALFLLGFELFFSGQKDRAQVIFERVARLESDDKYLKPFFDYFEKAAAESQG